MRIVLIIIGVILGCVLGLWALGVFEIALEFLSLPTLLDLRENSNQKSLVFSVILLLITMVFVFSGGVAGGLVAARLTKRKPSSATVRRLTRTRRVKD